MRELKNSKQNSLELSQKMLIGVDSIPPFLRAIIEKAEPVCLTCKGTGWAEATVCLSCRGTGDQEKYKALRRKAGYLR